MKDHVFNLGNQLKTELELSSDFNFPIYNELLVVGMGGSGVAGDVLKNIIVENSNKKVEVRKTYQLPKIHNPSNLFLLFISYSGNTEETISAAEEAIKLNLNWGAIASGGKLLDLASEHNKSFVVVPSGLQPRAAFGLMTKAVVHFISSDVQVDGISLCNEAGDYLNELIKEKDKSELAILSKKIANSINKKTSIIYAGTVTTFLVAQRWKTQINENAKSKAYTGYMPEVHHNEILSWEADSEGSKNNFILIFLKDLKDHLQVQKRYDLTKTILGEEVEIIEVENISSNNPIKEIFYLTLLGDLVSVYQAELLGIDPYDIKKIENLKQMLKGN